jgi:predicted nuclease of predicted toxin-antitoxin system
MINKKLLLDLENIPLSQLKDILPELQFKMAHAVTNHILNAKSESILQKYDINYHYINGDADAVINRYIKNAKEGVIIVSNDTDFYETMLVAEAYARCTWITTSDNCSGVKKLKLNNTDIVVIDIN